MCVRERERLSAPTVEVRRIFRPDMGFVFKAHRLCVSLNSRLENNKVGMGFGVRGLTWMHGFRE